MKFKKRKEKYEIFNKDLIMREIKDKQSIEFIAI